MHPEGEVRQALGVPEGGAGASVSQGERGAGSGDPRHTGIRAGTRPAEMEFLLGNPFSTPVGQCLGKAARGAGVE